MKTVNINNLYIIIQARMTSTRLPKKIMLPLCNSTVLETLINRLYLYKDNIIIATTNDGTEKDIIDLCIKLNIKYFKGSTENVLERYYQSAKKYNLKKNDIIIRITSDCPLIDVQIMQKTIDKYLSGNYDYVSNRIERTIPIGLDVEVFNYKILQEMYDNAILDFEKEHVTPYIYISNKNKYRIGSYKEINDYSKYRLTLDEKDDYLAIKEIYRKFNNNIDFSYNELIDMLESNQYIYDINKNIKQKIIVN